MLPRVDAQLGAMQAERALAAEARGLVEAVRRSATGNGGQRLRRHACRAGTLPAPRRAAQRTRGGAGVDGRAGQGSGARTGRLAGGAGRGGRCCCAGCAANRTSPGGMSWRMGSRGGSRSSRRSGTRWRRCSGRPNRFPELQRHHDEVYDRLLGGTTARAAGPLLDVGSGDGAALAATLEGTNVWGVALDRRRLHDWRGPAGFARVQADGARLPFRDRAFRAALSMETVVMARRPRRGRAGDGAGLAESGWSWCKATGRRCGSTAAIPTPRGSSRGCSRGPGTPARGASPAWSRGPDCGRWSTSCRRFGANVLQRGTYAFELLRLLREYLVVQHAVVRARRFDEWREELDARAQRGAFSFSQERRLAVGTVAPD